MNDIQNVEHIIRDAFYSLSNLNKDSSIDDVSITSLGMDSLGFFEFIVELEEVHNISIPIDSLGDEITLKSLINAAVRG